uniref:Putative cuticular protein 25 n=1 Tax=Anopheles triannulatus TaxID=58253 RepID=A0A2M4B1L9_9DIPT
MTPTVAVALVAIRDSCSARATDAADGAPAVRAVPAGAYPVRAAATTPAVARGSRKMVGAVNGASCASYVPVPVHVPVRAVHAPARLLAHVPSPVAPAHELPSRAAPSHAAAARVPPFHAVPFPAAPVHAAPAAHAPSRARSRLREPPERALLHAS